MEEDTNSGSRGGDSSGCSACAVLRRKLHQFCGGDGADVTYTVVETAVPDGYAVAYAPAAGVQGESGTITVTNTHEPEPATEAPTEPTTEAPEETATAAPTAPAGPSSRTPTSDNSHGAMWVLVMAAAAATAAGTLAICSRRRDET